MTTFSAEVDYDVRQHNYYFEFLTFRGADEGKTLIEVFCQVPLQSLYVIENGDKLMTKYSLSLTLQNLDDGTAETLSHVDSADVGNAAPGATVDNPLIRFAFRKRPGNYRVAIQVTDKVTNHAVHIDRELVVPDYAEQRLLLSDLQIATSITNTTDSGLLVKNGKRVVPNVSHAVNAAKENLLQVYSEVYNLDYAADNRLNQFRTTFLITDHYGREVKRLYLTFDKPGESCAYGVGIPIRGIASGAYTLTFIVEDLDNAQITTRDAHFTLIRPTSDMNDKEFTKTLEQLKYIVDEQDLEALRLLPAHKRLAGLQRLWEKLDPIPETEQNEMMIEFYRRLYYTNQYFDHNVGEGWQTDQGKIYIQNGPPDSIERVFADENSATSVYEIWEYHELDRKYIFVDSWGVGDFQLVKTTAGSSAHDFTLHQGDPEEERRR